MYYIPLYWRSWYIHSIDCVQVNLQDSKGTTLLHRAASDGRVNCVRVLLDNKADSTAKVGNMCYSFFMNPVFYTEWQRKHSPPFCYLFVSSPLLCTVNSGEKILYCRRNRYQVARLLLERGSDPNERDKKGFTALHLAVCLGYSRLTRLLLENPNCQVNAQVLYKMQVKYLYI